MYLLVKMSAYKNGFWSSDNMSLNIKAIFLEVKPHTLVYFRCYSGEHVFMSKSISRIFLFWKERNVSRFGEVKKISFCSLILFQKYQEKLKQFEENIEAERSSHLETKFNFELLQVIRVLKILFIVNVAQRFVMHTVDCLKIVNKCLSSPRKITFTCDLFRFASKILKPLRRHSKSAEKIWRVSPETISKWNRRLS